MDVIYRKDAVREIANHLGVPAENWMKIAEEWLRDVPSAQPEEIALHESCTDCPLYDQNRHSCPRFNKVIPETLRELQSAQPETEERTAESAQNVPNDELISKKAAIDALAKAMPSWTTPDGSGEFDHDMQITDEAFVDCMQIINELPSAQLYLQQTCNKLATDCISRQAALNSPVKMVSEGLDWIPAYHIKDLPSAQPDWIPVTERLPVERTNPNTLDFERVLCSTTFGDVRAYKFGTPMGHSEPHFWHGAGLMDEYVVAWMPLPEPYAEREKDELRS